MMKLEYISWPFKNSNMLYMCATIHLVFFAIKIL